MLRVAILVLTLFFSVRPPTYAQRGPRDRDRDPQDQRGPQSPAPTGTWIGKDGKKFVADLVAADGLRATFAPVDKPRFVIPLTDLSPEDADNIRSWRATYFRTPLVDPNLIPKWPAGADAGKFDVKATGEDAGTYHFESPNFALTADLRLPLSAVRDIATVLEATRAVLIAIPLGLHAGGESTKYPVMLYGTPDAYAAAGGPSGSGGFYDARARRMLVLLPNFGIEQKGGVIRFNYLGNFFILKHEVTHQLLARWHGGFPMWLSEGIAEFIASLPYSAGHYTLQKPGAGLHDYILKWRKAKDDAGITLIPSSELMGLTERDWRKAMAQGAAYDLYNSSALLVWYFIQEDNGSRFAAYLDALRRGREESEATPLLLRNRKLSTIDEDVAAMAKKMGLLQKKPDVVGGKK